MSGVGDLIHYSYHSSGMKTRKETVMRDGYILDHAVFNISARDISLKMYVEWGEVFGHNTSR